MNCTCDEAWSGHPNPHALTCALRTGDVAIEDVRAIAVALGLGDHARPYSAHEVVQREILPALAARVCTCPDPEIAARSGHMSQCATRADNCTCGDTFNPKCPEHGGNEHRP